MTAARLGLVALALATQVACATMSKSSSLEALQDSVEAYNDAYRWKNYERAALFLPPEVRAPFLATYEEDDKALHVEGYRILRADLQSETAARVVIRMRYMQLPSVTLESKDLIQHWHKVASRWVLETEENSIREVDLKAGMPDPSAFGGGTPEADPELEVEVTDPQGQVIRKDGAPAPEVAPEGAETTPATSPK